MLIDTPHAVNVTWPPSYDAHRGRKRVVDNICGCATQAIRQENKGDLRLPPLAVFEELIKSCSCSFFQWATFDDDGEPPWVQKHDSLQSKDFTIASP